MKALAFFAIALFATSSLALDYKASSSSEYDWVKPQAKGKGGLTQVKVVTPAKTIKVYRLWDSKGASSTPPRAQQWGAYWAEKDFSSESAARSGLAVCKEWNHMDKLTVCDLKVGTVVAIGPGQTAKCANGKTLAGGPLQVVIKDAQTRLKNCKTGSGF